MWLSPWSFGKVTRQMVFKGDKRKKKNKKHEASVKMPMIVIPYVEKVLEAIVRSSSSSSSSSSMSSSSSS